MANQPQVPAKADDKTVAALPVYKALDRSADEMENIMRIFAANMGGEKINDRDLDRITVPAGGSTVWTIPGPDGDTHTETLEGILVMLINPRAYWSKSMEEAGGQSPPDCSSADGVRGDGDPGGVCPLCPFDRWGSDPGENRKGKACKEKRMLYLLQYDTLLPRVVQGPSTSIQTIKKYLLRLSSSEKPYYGVYTQLTLQKVEGGSFPYSQIIPKSIGDVPDEVLPQLTKYVDSLKTMLGVQPTAIVQDE